MADLNPVQGSSPISEALNGALYGDFNDKPTGASIAGQIGTGMIPIVGQIADARDTAAAFDDIRQGVEGGWSNLGLALIAWVPVVGDGAKGMARGRNFFDIVPEIFAPVTKRVEALYGKIFHKPTIRSSFDITPNTGGTDEYGNIVVSALSSRDAHPRIVDHEKVHSFLSPKFKPLLYESRAKLGQWAYWNSHALRFLEEGLAESYSILKNDGISAWRTIKPSVTRLLSHPNYRMDYAKVKKEGIMTAGGILAAGGAAQIAMEKLFENADATEKTKLDD